MTHDILTTIFSPFNLLMMNIGMAAGIIIGALPGLSAVIAITILLPVTFGLESIPGMYILLGAYCGAVFGGSITAILINTPGTPSAAATTLDGYRMAQNGRAGDALRCALTASTVGGLLSCFSLLFIAPTLAKMALKFGPAEYFSLCLFGLTIVVSISGENVFKGLVMAGLGLFASTVGIDATEGTPRFIFGNSYLLTGFNAAVVMLGVFAISEVLDKSRRSMESSEINTKYAKATMSYKEIFKHWKTMLWSSIYGIFIGAVPGTGGAISAFFSYNEAKRRSKHPEKFGTGIPEGVIAPETGNNAVTGATLIPLLTLGIPGDTAVAVLFGALTMQGIIPGPELFSEDKFWVYCIMGGLFIINIFMFLQGALFNRLFANVARIPFSVLVPCIVIFCVIGGFSVANNSFNVFVLLGFGLLGYIMKRLGFPLAPMTIALVLGKLTENNLRRALILSQGSISIFFTRPLSLVFLLIAVASLLYPSVRKLIKNKKAGKATN